MGAMIALESLNKTNSHLAATQKQVSTGYRVADATDDGAAYAVAQSVRSTVGALTSCQPAARQRARTAVNHAVWPERRLQHDGQHA